MDRLNLDVFKVGVGDNGFFSNRGIEQHATGTIVPGLDVQLVVEKHWGRETDPDLFEPFCVVVKVHPATTGRSGRRYIIHGVWVRRNRQSEPPRGQYAKDCSPLRVDRYVPGYRE